MKIRFDPKLDIIRIIFRDAPTEESDEEKPGVILDYDADGKLVGLEILNVSRYAIDLHTVEFAIVEPFRQTE